MLGCFFCMFNFFFDLNHDIARVNDLVNIKMIFFFNNGCMVVLSMKIQAMVNLIAKKIGCEIKLLFGEQDP